MSQLVIKKKIHRNYLKSSRTNPIQFGILKSFRKGADINHSPIHTGNHLRVGEHILSDLARICRFALFFGHCCDGSRLLLLKISRVEFSLFNYLTGFNQNLILAICSARASRDCEFEKSNPGFFIITILNRYQLKQSRN